jgi:predicted transglutaminase-like cysteine proteinase
MSVRHLRAQMRIIVGAFALLSFGAAAQESPQPAAIGMSIPRDIPQGSTTRIPRSDLDLSEPFGNAIAQPRGVLLDKWNAAKAELRVDIDIIAGCRAAPQSCDSMPAQRLIAIVEQAQQRAGRALIGEINRAVNLAIIATSDQAQYGVEDKWASPLMTFTSGRGDCEDYALAKYAALRAAGFADADLRLLIVRLPQLKTDHAVLSVRHDGRWLVLDNRRFAMLDITDLDAVPLFALREDSQPPASMAALNREPYLL